VAASGRDRELGLDRGISRRDFLNGVALGAAGIALSPLDLLAETPAGVRYPPALTGLRGSHDGSWEVAHSLRDGTFWAKVGGPRDTGETYDLVVVGAGLSGLSGAHFFREATGAKARVLLLDNHDDFGGHARRNEFTLNGRTFLGYGGTYAIDSPLAWSPVATGLVRELGVDVSRWEASVDRALYPSLGMTKGVFFDRETFGVDRLVRWPEPDTHPATPTRGPAVAAAEGPWRTFLGASPLSDVAQRDLLKLVTGNADHMPGLSVEEKKARLARMSYADFLTTVAGCHKDVLPFLQSSAKGLFGLGIDAVPAQDAWGLGLPGFQGMDLTPTAGPGTNLDAVPYDHEPYFFHFPDGNATLARLLVRQLVPPAIPGRTVDDLVTARADYARLDEAGAPVRLRLESTVVRVRHRGEPAMASEAEVAYVRGGRLETVRGRRVVLACWNSVIPHIVPDLPAEQKEALAFAVKVPLVYTSVLLRDWKAWVKAGVHDIDSPGSYWTDVSLNAPVTCGDHEASRRPEDPIVLHLARAPGKPGLPAREQHAAGRTELLATPFLLFERQIRDQLARALGPSGFDAARDIAAITVNRWPHGYAYQYNSLFDAFWLENRETPCQRARRPFGLVAIANADSAAYSYTDAAFDQAFRAVQEILPRRG
jgi:spermidine dehydrogenase